MDELRAEACTEDEVTFRNARSKVSAFMKKAGLSIESSEVSTMSRAMNPVDSETLAAKSSAANAALERRVAESNQVMAAKQEEMMRKTAAIQQGTIPVPGDRNSQAGCDRCPGLRGVDRRDARAREFYDKLYDGKRQHTGGGGPPKPPPPPGLVLKPKKIWGQDRGAARGGGGGRRN